MNSDNVITLAEGIFLFFFVVLVFGVPAFVFWASTSKAGWCERFDVSTLWLHNDRVDKFAVIVLGTWWVHTCSMILWTLLRQVQTQDYLTYMAWGTLIIGKMLVSKDAGAEATPR